MFRGRRALHVPPRRRHVGSAYWAHPLAVPGSGASAKVRAPEVAGNRDAAAERGGGPTPPTSAPRLGSRLRHLQSEKRLQREEAERHAAAVRPPRPTDCVPRATLPTATVLRPRPASGAAVRQLMRRLRWSSAVAHRPSPTTGLRDVSRRVAWRGVAWCGVAWVAMGWTLRFGTAGIVVAAGRRGRRRRRPEPGTDCDAMRCDAIRSGLFACCTVAAL